MTEKCYTYHLPPIWAINERLNKNPIQQLIVPEQSIEATQEPFTRDVISGSVIRPIHPEGTPILVISSGKPSDDFDKVLGSTASRGAGANGIRPLRWIRHPDLASVPSDPINYQARLQDVTRSWKNAFAYREEDPDLHCPGLRSPQIGAIHAIHAHWVTSHQAATIVMPTGTGKTETMLSILVSKQCPRLLVVVPTDALRIQLVGKFLTLGVLKDFGVIAQTALYPIVGILKHKPKTYDEVDAFFEKCNVIVTTMQVAGQCADALQARMAQLCPYLFIDEAHHTGATTWQLFRRAFEKRAILQFTATPFRNDGKLVDGKIIFNYPLKKALEEGYFKPIHFQSVVEFDRRKSDQVIAQQAVEQLRKDLEHHDHILMARVESIDRAAEVYPLYARYAEFNPVQIHTGITSKQERDRLRQMILNKQTRIIVCVDMLGEGFDLPELKVAAMHDVKKS